MTVKAASVETGSNFSDFTCTCTVASAHSRAAGNSKHHITIFLLENGDEKHGRPVSWKTEV
jgi:hypothetical protein